MRRAADLVSLGSQLIKVNVTVVDAFFFSFGVAAFCFLLLFLLPPLSLSLFLGFSPHSQPDLKSAQRTDLAASRTKKRNKHREFSKNLKKI